MKLIFSCRHCHDRSDPLSSFICGLVRIELCYDIKLLRFIDSRDGEESSSSSWQRAVVVLSKNGIEQSDSDSDTERSSNVSSPSSHWHVLMPRGPSHRPTALYGWLCVLHSAAEILGHAARIRAQQATRVARVSGLRAGFEQSRTPATKLEPEGRDEDAAWEGVNLESDVSENKSAAPVIRSSSGSTHSELVHSFVESSIAPGHVDVPHPTEENIIVDAPSIGTLEVPPVVESQKDAIQILETKLDAPGRRHTADVPTSAAPNLRYVYTQTHRSTTTHIPSHLSTVGREAHSPSLSPSPSLPHSPVLNETLIQQPHRNLQASRVPSSRIGRLFHYGGLAASLGYGAAAEALRRTVDTSGAESDGGASRSLVMSPANVSRLVEKLSRMRGAALKVGQFLSIQGH